MIDFNDLEARNSDAIDRVARTDEAGRQRGACGGCDCPEWVGWLDGSELPAARPYLPQRHELANEGPADECRRCGCRASWHEDISELIARLSSDGALVEAEEGWSDHERWLFYRTGGAFCPRGPLDRYASEGASTGGPGPLVSVICPTEADRREFHASLYDCFREQTYEPKELIVVDTGEGGKWSEFFTQGLPATDRRVIYRYFDVFSLPWSIGVKRNVACHLARGAIIVHFDDDDLYAPTYLAWMVRAMQEGEACGSKGVRVRVAREEDAEVGGEGSAGEGPLLAKPKGGGEASAFRHPSYAAGAATFSAWHTYSALTGTFGLCDVDDAFGGRRDWALGYGFSFAYLRNAWQMHWFRDANLCEDRNFFESLLARGVAVALLRDEGAGLCAHVRHKSNFSPWEHTAEVDVATVGPALPALGERLRSVILKRDRTLSCLGANGEVRLTPKTAEAMQDDLLAGFANQAFQRRLHEAYAAAGEDPVRRKKECRRVCLEVQGPIISKFGFEPSWDGVLKSTAAFSLVMSEEWGRPETLSSQKGELICWLMQPEWQHAEPKPFEEVLGSIAHLQRVAAARRRKD